MTDEEYGYLRAKYGIHSQESFAFFLRQHAFDEFDAQLEAYCENGYEENNNGKRLIDITPAVVELILDDYIERFDDEGQWFRERMMRNAIQDVTGLIC